MQYCLTVPKNGDILALKQAMQKVTGISTRNVSKTGIIETRRIILFVVSVCFMYEFMQLVVIDVYHSRFHRVYYDKDAISQIMDRDDIYLLVFWLLILQFCNCNFVIAIKNCNELLYFNILGMS